MVILHMNPIYVFMYKGDEIFYPKELTALAGEAEEPRAMRAAPRMGGITLTNSHSLLSLPCGDPVVCPPAGLFHAAMTFQFPPWAGTASPEHGSTPSDHSVLPSCRKDLECQGHDGQQWPLKGLRIRQL